MIRQLRRLTRPLPAAGAGALAIATYAEARNGDYTLRPAADTGFEGVACVDDAARAVVLYCEIWQKHRFPWARQAAQGLLRFVTFMQDEQGPFTNFILDWDGHKNLSGPTSFAGGWWWTARAMHALAWGTATFGEKEYAERFDKGLCWLDQPTTYLDVRAVSVLAALEYWRATGAAHAATCALTWAEQIASRRLGDLLPNEEGQADIHLWGHIQEVALVRAAVLLERPEFVEVAKASAEALLIPHVARAFEARSTLAYDVSCTVLGLDAVAGATGEQRYSEHAALARRWFSGRNAACRPMYDRRRGMVYDGIDEGRINFNSGAESNVEGGLALVDSLPWSRYGSPASGRNVHPGLLLSGR